MTVQSWATAGLFAMDQLWQKALDALDKGDFSRLELMLGGPDLFDEQIIIWYEKGNFEAEPEMLAETLTCACMLGRTTSVRYLLDKGVDPLAGIKTGLNGFHYAASAGRLRCKRIQAGTRRRHRGAHRRWCGDRTRDH